MSPRELQSVPEQAAVEGAPDLRDAVREAIGAMAWLEKSDEALKTLALRQAEEIEKAVDRAEELQALMRDAAGQPDLYKRLQKLEAMCDVTKTVGWLGPQLQGVLRDLCGTPSARKAMDVKPKVVGRLAQLRADAQD